MISIVIPVKNRSEKLKRSIQSVLNQTHADFEILVVDDKSSEDLKEVVNGFKDNRIKYILNQSEISNANVCRNIGLDSSKADFIAFLDSDDEWKEDHLKSRLDFITQYNIDGCFGSNIVKRVNSESEIISRELKENERSVNYLFDGGFAQTSSFFLKTDFAKRVRFDENYFRHQDFDFFIRSMKSGILSPCNLLTVILHWEDQDGTKIHSGSAERFFNEYSDEMSWSTKKKFLIATIQNLHKRNTQKDKRDIKSFRKLFLKNRDEVTFKDFLSIQRRLNIIKKILYRFEFLLYKLKII